MADFSFITDLLYRESGLAIGPEKAYLVNSRLASVSVAWGGGTLRGLVVAMRAERNLPRTVPRPVTLAVCDALTTNETLFFRDGHPFLALRDTVLPEAATRRRQAAGAASPQPVRIWCAAASTGQEPYSVAMCVALAAPRMAGVPVEIVATDFSPRALARAREGVYSEFEARRGLAADHMTRFFVATADGFRVADSLRRAVRFDRRNLLEPFADLGTFDIVLCRNVLIYFDPTTKGNVLDRIAGVLRPGGTLFVGGTETPIGVSTKFRRSTRTSSTTYERLDG